MEVRECKKCGKLFNYMGRDPICPACNKELEEKFMEVKSYIYDNPQAGIKQVSDDNEVSVSIIKKWIREERLTFAEGSAVGIECERCGKNILTGRYCGACKQKVQDNLSGVYEPKKRTEQNIDLKGSSDGKMRFVRKH